MTTTMFFLYETTYASLPTLSDGEGVIWHSSENIVIGGMTVEPQDLLFTRKQGTTLQTDLLAQW